MSGSQLHPVLIQIRQRYGLPKDIIQLIDEYLACPHNNKCHLKSTNQCCRCMDLRKSISYYKDGYGFIISTNRRRYYCPGCKK